MRASFDYGDTGDASARCDTGACHGRLAPRTEKPYAVVAARAGAGYLSAMIVLEKMLPNFKRKGVTP